MKNTIKYKKKNRNNKIANDYVRYKLFDEVEFLILQSVDNYNHLFCIFEENTEKYKDILSKEKIEILSIVLSFMGF